MLPLAFVEMILYKKHGGVCLPGHIAARLTQLPARRLPKTRTRPAFLERQSSRRFSIAGSSAESQMSRFRYGSNRLAAASARLAREPIRLSTVSCALLQLCGWSTWVQVIVPNRRPLMEKAVAMSEWTRLMRRCSLNIPAVAGCRAASTARIWPTCSRASKYGPTVGPL